MNEIELNWIRTKVCFCFAWEGRKQYAEIVEFEIDVDVSYTAAKI